jgi:hypothetical protein
MVRLIIQVIVDISTFFVILFYATLSFTFVFYLRNPEAEPFFMYLTQSYRLDLGDFETDLDNYFDWFLFFVSTMINPLIMLNLLIAIMSDTASAVAEIDDIYGLREQAEMIIDIEKVMFWKKEINHKHFLHKCDFFQVDDYETDKTKEKIKIIKKQSEKTWTKPLQDIQKTVSKLSVDAIHSNLNNCIAEQSYLKSELSNNLEKSKNLIFHISKKLSIPE